MANSLTSNVAAKLMRKFAAQFEMSSVLLNSIDRQTLQGQYTDQVGGSVSMKRPHLATTSRTTAGDISSETNKYVTSGKITGTVQQMVTVHSELTLTEIANSGDQMDEILRQRAEAINVEVEKDIQNFILKNGGLCIGTPGTPADAHSDVAKATGMVQELGCPVSDIYYTMGPLQVAELADAQTGLNDPTLVRTAWQDSLVSRNMGGATVLKNRVPVGYTTSTMTDRSGTLSGAPDVTYATAKDTMYQTLAVTGLNGGATVTVKAGDVLEFTGSRYYANPRTGNTVVGGDGSSKQWRTTVMADTALTSGAGNLVCSSAGLYESGGAYNNMNAALTTSDAFTILGTTGASYRPNLVYHKSAIAIGFIKLPKFVGQESYVMTKDGLSIRVSSGTNILTGKTTTRFDCYYALACTNPLWCGKAFGE